MVLNFDCSCNKKTFVIIFSNLARVRTTLGLCGLTGDIPSSKDVQPYDPTFTNCLEKLVSIDNLRRALNVSYRSIMVVKPHQVEQRLFSDNVTRLYQEKHRIQLAENSSIIYLFKQDDNF